MQPTKAITIVLVAMILTGMAGYLLQPTHETVTKTTYDYKGDLTPSVVYSQIDDWSEYNPLTNVTGWNGNGANVDIPISESATPYLKDPIIVSYTYSSVSSLKYHNSSGISDSHPPYTESDKFSLADRYYHSGIQTFTSTYYNFGSTLSTNNMIIQLTNGDTFWYNSANIGQVVYWSSLYHGSGYDTLLYNSNDQTVTPARLHEDGYYTPVDGATPTTLEHWFVVTHYNSTTGEYDAPVLSCGKPVLSTPTYIDATKFVTVESGVGTWINNQVNGTVRVLCTPNAQFVIGIGKTISCPIGLPYDYLLCTLDFHNGQFYCQGVDSFNNTLSYTVTDYKYDMTVVGEMPTSVTQLSVQANPDYVYTVPTITVTPLDESSSTLYPVNINYHAVDGRSSGNVRHALHTDGTYIIIIPIPKEGGGNDYVYLNSTLEVVDGVYHFTFIELTGYYGEPVYTYEGVTTMSNPITMRGESEELKMVSVFVDSTIVAVDPSGVFWGNPDMALKYFYPEQMEYDTRVLFNGFVKYGDSMTINGQLFPIIDGKLAYTHTVIKEGESVLVTDYYPIKGMAIDYIKDSGTSQFKVSIVFTEAQSYTIDLGNLDTTQKIITYTVSVYNPLTDQYEPVTKTIDTQVGYVVSATGTWYWQSGAYSIVSTTTDEVGLDITKGIFGLTMSSAALLMAFTTILITAGVVRFTNIELCFMDWIVLGCVGLLLLTVAVM